MILESENFDYCEELKQELLRCGKQIGLDDKTIDKLNEKLSKAIFTRWGGFSIYFKKTMPEHTEKLEARKQAIQAEFNNGMKVRQIARKYKISEAWIYKSLKG